MPSSDERREVAARLRTEVGEDECIDYAVFRIINDALLINGAWGAKAARILADLIDPITTVELRAPWTICMKCGARMEGYQHKPVRFCPHFGRRIVR